MQAQFVLDPGSSAVVADLPGLIANDRPGLPTGFSVYVVAENEVYRLDTQNPLTTSSPLIVPRGATSGAGKWYRRSRAYVVGNFTLWVAPFGSGPTVSSSNEILGFTPGQLTASSSNAPDIILDLRPLFPEPANTLYDVVTDAWGNLWCSSFVHGHPTPANGDTFKILLKNCLQSGTPPAAVHLTGTGTTAIPTNTIWNQAGFDKQNNLWISCSGHASGKANYLMYSPATYAQGGNPNPDVVLSLAMISSDSESFVFDGAGNLWAAAFGNSPAVLSVYMLAQAQLYASNPALIPAVMWEGSNFGTSDPNGIAFGNNGLLWVTFYGSNVIKAFDPRNPVSGNQAPVLTLSCAAFNGPTGICFDAAGNMWICNDNDNKIFMFTPAQQVAAGLQVATVTLDQPTLPFLVGLTFPNNVQRSGLLASGLPT